MKDQTYRPENPQYAISEDYSTFPREMSFGGETEEKAIKAAMEQLIAEPTTDVVVRLMDDTEISDCRAEYTDLLENVRPEECQKLADLLGQEAIIKEKIKAQREVLQSISQHVNDCIQTIKCGTTSEELDGSRSFRLAVDGHYLHYTYSGGRFLLAKVNRIPEKDRDNLFVRNTVNQEVFLRMFGVDFSPRNNFEEREVCKDTAEELIGRTLAADAVVQGDSGELNKVCDRDTEIDEVVFADLLEKGVEFVFVYKNPEDAAPEA